jgi:hypothetical protein
VSDNPNVDQRTPSVSIDLAEVGRSLLGEAGANDDGRSALTLTPGRSALTLTPAVGGPLK